MDMVQDTKTVVRDIALSLETLPAFSCDDYIPYVKSRLGLDRADILQPCTATLYGEYAGGEPTVIDRFKVETIALAVSRSSRYGFSDTVLKVRALTRQGKERCR